jgi:hypothetical protein
VTYPPSDPSARIAAVIQAAQDAARLMAAVQQAAKEAASLNEGPSR